MTLTTDRDLRRFPLTRQEEEDLNARLREENKLTDLKERAEHALQMASQRSDVYGTLANLSVQAAEDLPAFAPTTMGGYRANSASSKAVGVSTAPASLGFNAQVTSMGTVTNPAWSWTPGVSVFLNGTSLSHTPPSTGFVQQIGVAKTSDTLFVYPQQPIQL